MLVVFGLDSQKLLLVNAEPLFEPGGHFRRKGRIAVQEVRKRRTAHP